MFDKNQEAGTRNKLGQGICLGLNIQQIFHLLNKKIKKKKKLKRSFFQRNE